MGLTDVRRAAERCAKATERRDEAFRHRAHVFEAAYEDGATLTAIADAAGVTIKAVKVAIWPPDGQPPTDLRRTA